NPGHHSRYRELFHSLVSLVTFKKLFDQKRKISYSILKRRRQQIQGMKVAGRGENFQYSSVELTLTGPLAFFHFQESELEEFEPLDWINSMHRALERQVHIGHLQ